MKRARILVADDHSIILAGVRSLVEHEWELAGFVGDGRSLVTEALNLRPDLIIVDIGLPLLNGIDAARQIRKAWPEARIVFLTMHANLMYLKEVMRSGALGYVLKTSATEELPTAIRRALKGERYVSSAFRQEEVFEAMGTPSGRPARLSVRLTDCQRQVLQLVAEGRTSDEIASILGISVKTVQFHRGRLMRKFGVHTAVRLIPFAVREGLVNE